VSRPLRIFLSCQQALRRHAVPAYSFWSDYFRGGLAEAGHTCIEAPDCDWAEGLLPLDETSAAAWLERTWGAALDFLRREHARERVDFFLGYLFPRQVLPSAVSEIRALGIPCVNFFCDNVREFRCVPEAYKGFDLHWVPEYKAVSLYQRAGLPWINAPMPCWVPPAHRGPAATETLPVTFVGTRDEQRERLFADAIQRGLDIELRGVGWDAGATPAGAAPPRAGNPFTLAQRQFAFAHNSGWSALVRKHASMLRPAPAVKFDFAGNARPTPVGDAYWEVLRQSIVCLGVSRFPSFRFPASRPGSYSRLRDIEAPMAGACYLTELTEGLDQLYELGSEIETYRDAAELVEKATSLARDAGRRKKLRRAGQRRAQRDHTIMCTVERILQQW